MLGGEEVDSPNNRWRSPYHALGTSIDLTCCYEGTANRHKQGNYIVKVVLLEDYSGIRVQDVG